uniref:Secreted protein n=1 Tax=Parascaris univalens TaxID=6257 RepID=A0A914ZT49_PARUN
MNFFGIVSVIFRWHTVRPSRQSCHMYNTGSMSVNSRVLPFSSNLPFSSVNFSSRVSSGSGPEVCFVANCCLNTLYGSE